MSVRKESLGSEVPLEAILAALVKASTEDGYTQVSVEEVEDAPELEIHHNFQLDLYELRVRG